MRATTIRKLIELVQESGIDALEVRSWWRSVRITRKHPAASTNGSSPHGADESYSQQTITVSAPPAQPRTQAAPTAPASAPAPVPAAEPAGNLVEIKSPMVGTFYASPSPDSPAFVKVGDSVSVGTVVCIVEAMKLMNEIESESKGKISKIMVENGQPVEFGQVLFLIDPSA